MRVSGWFHIWNFMWGIAWDNETHNKALVVYLGPVGVIFDFAK